MSPAKSSQRPPSSLSQGTTQSLKATVESLVAEWEADVAALSSTTARAQHPSYRAIVGMGPDVVPLLLRELEAATEPLVCSAQVSNGADQSLLPIVAGSVR